MFKKNEFDGCDGALWYVEITKKNDELMHEVDSTIYRYNDIKVEPDDLGFYYHVLTYKEDKSGAEILSAYIGDVGHFINNHARAGYNGLLVKSKVMPKKTIKEMFTRVLSNWEFSPKLIRNLVKQV